MVIDDSEATEKPYLNNLERGEAFWYRGDIYIRTDEEKSCRLHDGVLTNIRRSVRVRRAHVEVKVLAPAGGCSHG